MNYRYDDQQQQLLNIVDRGTPEQLFTFLQEYHRQPFQSLTEVLRFATVIDDQIDFIDCTGTRYNVTPLIIAAGKGSFEKTKILLVHGANPNKQCGTGDTALNLAVHRQKYLIVNLLLQYRANPNLYNHAGKTALHRAVAAYTNENAQQIRLLLDSGANLYAEDRNQRIPLDEAVIANKPDIIDVLISYDRTLIQHSYRAAILASRLGHDTCLQRLLNYGLNPNISDQTNTTPLHVAVRSLKPSTARLLLANGADPKISNNRGETPLTIAEYLQPDQQQDFLNLLNQNSRALSSDSQLINPVASVYPLLQCRSNWTLNSDEYRSQTANDSSVENLLNTTTGTFWRSTQSKNAWVIFDFKHQYNITGIRIVGCENPSMPRNGYLEISNSLKGPWFKVTDFTCRFDQETKTDVFFSSTKTRFVRVNIQDNYGGNDIQIQAICFFGVDTRLINLLQEYRLENSLNTLLSNGINDQESLYDNQDEILNSSDKYLHVNDHFQFIHLIESLKKPQLTFLEWFVLPQTTAIAGEKFHTFSVTSDENLTDRVQLEEQLENSPQATVVLMKDLEPIQGHSLVDFSDYIIKQPGRYRIRVSSIESPHIHTTWHAIVVGSSLPYPSSLRTSTDERLYLSSTTQFLNDTSSDKDNTLNSRQRETIIFANKNNRSLIQRIYESDNDEFVSFQPIEQSPYYFPLIDMSHRTTSDNLNANGLINYRPNQPYKPEHYTQTKPIDYFDHSTNTDDELLDESFNQTRFKSIKPNKEIYLTPTKYRTNSRTPLSNIFSYNNNNDNNNSHRHEQQQRQENTNYNDDDNETLGYGEKIIIPTKYRLKQERKKQLMNGENLVRSPVHTLKQQNGFHRDHSPEEEENNYYVSTPPPPQQQQQRQSQHKSRSQTQDYERRQFQNSSPVPQQQKKQSIYNTTRNGLKRETPPLQEQSNYYRFDARFNSNQLIEPTQPPQEQPNQDDVDEPQNETQRKESIKSPSLQYQQHQTPQTQKDLSRDSSSERTPSQYYELDHAQQQNQPSSNHQQKQPWERINSDARVSPSVIKQEQQQLYTKRDEIEQDPIYYDEVVNTQSESDQESPVQYQKRPEQSPVQYQKRPEQSPYNHFQIIAGDFELRASPRDENVDLNESKPTQMQLIFKATLQGPDVEKRARHSIRELVTQRSRSQSNTSNRTNSIDTKKTSLAKNPQSLNPTDRQKVNSTDIISTYEQEDQTESNRNSRSNSMAYMGQSPLKRIQPDQVDLLVTPKRTSIPIPPSSLLRNDSVQQTNLDDQPSAKRRNTENDQTFDGIHEQTPPITVQNYIPLTYERNPFRRTDNPVTSPILSPSKAEQKAKYYFGKSVPSQQSDNEEENDNEVECETFGHSSQPRLLTSTSAKRNLDYPSTTNPQFEQQTDAKTSISDSLAQELRRRFVNQNQTSTEQANDSPKKSQTSPQSNNEASDSYLTPTNYNAISQIPSNAASTGFQRQYPSDSNIYEQASEIKPIQEESSPPRRFPENKTDERPTHSNEDENDDGEEEDDDDDNNHDNQHNDDSQTDDDAEEDQDVHDQKQNDHSYVNEVVREEEESQQPSNAYQSGISTLVQQDPVRDTTNDNAPPQYPVPLTTQQKPPKQKGGFFSKKPLEISVRTPDRSHSYTPGIIPPKLPSTPTTDTTDELADGETFDKPQNFRQTPDPFFRESHNQNDDDDDAEDSDSMAEVRQHNRDRSMQRQLQTKKCRDYGTQMEEKGTRTIGTMSEPIKTRNAGNEVQPQSSSTQTLTRLQDHQEDELDYHRPQRKTNLRSSSQSPQRDDYSDYDHHPRSKSHRSHLSSSKDPHHTPPPPVEYRTPSPSNHHRHASRSQRSRSPSSSSQRRSRQTQRSPSPSLSRYYLKSSSHLPRTSSPPVQYRSTSHHSRDRPQMVSTETDTSLDGMKFTKNRGVQPDPLPSTRDYGVSTSTEKVYPTETNQSPKISQSQYQPLYPTVTKREDFGLTSPNQSKRRSVRNDEPLSTSKSYRLRPQSNDSFVNNYERLPGKEDDTLSHADNRSQPRTSIIAPLSDDEEDDRRQSRLSYPNDEVIKQLARGDSISIPSTTVVQPDTLPRSFTQHQQPNSYDNRKKPTQTPIHHGRSQRTPPKDDSVAYHIGTQNILHQSPTNEFATPFKVRYVEDANNDFSLNNNQIRSSTLKREDLRARSQQIILLPVINSARTYVFEKQSIPAHRMRQSRTNRNFYLAKSPTLRSLNSSFHIDESEIDPLTQIIESDNLNGHTLRSEVA